jgi:hypothetical protein
MVASPDAGACGGKPVGPAARHVRELGNQAIGPKGSDVSAAALRCRVTYRGVRLGVSDSILDTNVQADWGSGRARAWNRAYAGPLITADFSAAVVRVTTVGARVRRRPVDELPQNFSMVLGHMP